MAPEGTPLNSNIGDDYPTYRTETQRVVLLQDERPALAEGVADTDEGHGGVLRTKMQLLTHKSRLCQGRGANLDHKLY